MLSCLESRLIRQKKLPIKLNNRHCYLSVSEECIFQGMCKAWATLRREVWFKFLWRWLVPTRLPWLPSLRLPLLHFRPNLSFWAPAPTLINIIVNEFNWRASPPLSHRISHWDLKKFLSTALHGMIALGISYMSLLIWSESFFLPKSLINFEIFW